MWRASSPPDLRAGARPSNVLFVAGEWRDIRPVGRVAGFGRNPFFRTSSEVVWLRLRVGLDRFGCGGVVGG